MRPEYRLIEKALSSCTDYEKLLHILRDFKVLGMPGLGSRYIYEILDEMWCSKDISVEQMHAVQLNITGQVLRALALALSNRTSLIQAAK